MLLFPGTFTHGHYVLISQIKAVNRTSGTLDLICVQPIQSQERTSIKVFSDFMDSEMWREVSNHRLHELWRRHSGEFELSIRHNQVSYRYLPLKHELEVPEIASQLHREASHI